MILPSAFLVILYTSLGFDVQLLDTQIYCYKANEQRKYNTT
jgi:hypothetical protein